MGGLRAVTRWASWAVYGATTRVAPTTDSADPDAPPDPPPVGAPLVGAPTLGDVIGAFKSTVTMSYAHGVGAAGWPPFHRRLWQRNYFEHVIRSARELDRVRRYIDENPQRRDTDAENQVRGAV